MSKKILKDIKAIDSKFHKLGKKMDNELYEEEQAVKNSFKGFYITSSCIPKVGDVVVQTTADNTFRFDGSTGNFGTAEVNLYKVYGEIISKDYSDYNPKNCRNGGKYGFTSIKVVMVE